MAKLVKKEGVTVSCTTCNQTMTCREKTSEGFGTTLQWQTPEGKSHYLAPTKNVEGKMVYQCRGYTTDGKDGFDRPTSSKIKTSWEILEEKSIGQQTLQDGFQGMRALAYELVKTNYPEMDDQTDKFGTIVNATIGHLVTMATITALKESKNA